MNNSNYVTHTPDITSNDTSLYEEVDLNPTEYNNGSDESNESDYDVPKNLDSRLNDDPGYEDVDEYEDEDEAVNPGYEGVYPGDKGVNFESYQLLPSETGKTNDTKFGIKLGNTAAIQKDLNKLGINGGFNAYVVLRTKKYKRILKNRKKTNTKYNRLRVNRKYTHKVCRHTNKRRNRRNISKKKKPKRYSITRR